MNAQQPPDGCAWIDDAVAAEEAADYGIPARLRLLQEGQADPDGPAARRLLTFASHERATTRRAALTLLGTMCPADRSWPAGTQAAERALDDPDERIRRLAAGLLVAAGEPDRCAAVLAAATDPVVRVALADAMTMHRLGYHDRTAWTRPLLALRDDALPAIRVLANLTALEVACAADGTTLEPAGASGGTTLEPAGASGGTTLEPAGASGGTTPETTGDPDCGALDAAVRADLDGAEGVLGAPGSRSSRSAGERWAWTFLRPGREEAGYTWARRLLDPAESPVARRAGVALAHSAMLHRRDAAARLVPHLTGLLAVEPSALPVLTASLTATRLAADDLAALLGDPRHGAAAATALGCVGDQRAVPYVAALMRSGSREPHLTEALIALAPGSAALVDAARQAVAAAPPVNRGMWWETAHGMGLRVLITARQGAAAAAPEVVARLRAGLERGDLDSLNCTIHALRAIGPAARAAVPLLASITDHCDQATLALLWITGDRGIADRHLAECPENLSRGGILASGVLSWLTRHGGLTGRQHRQLRALFDGRRGYHRIRAAGAVWRHEGPAAAGDLLRVLPRFLDDDLQFPRALRVLGAMGSHALPLLPTLDDMIERRHRWGFSMPDLDEEMRADERLVDAAIRARAAITGERDAADCEGGGDNDGNGAGDRGQDRDSAGEGRH